VVAVFSGVFPILPGKEDAARAWIAEASGPRRDGWDEMQHKSGLTRETLALQETPMGSFLLIWFEGNVEQAFATVATEQDEFTAWHRDKLREVTGIDLNNPAEGPGPELLLDWSA
jgi:hypothetical protein